MRKWIEESSLSEERAAEITEEKVSTATSIISLVKTKILVWQGGGTL